jgi:hypothetical protein
MALNPRNQKKWDSLQSAGDNSVEKILAGKGTDADIKALSHVLAEQHTLAGEIFDQSVQDAQTTADTIVDRLNKERIDSGKKPLTLKAHDRIFQSTFQKVMAESLEDILAMVHQEFEAHAKEVREKVEQALEKLQGKKPELTPAPGQPAPTRSLFERFAGYVGQRDGFDPTAPTQKRSLLDRVLGRKQDANAPRTSMLQTIKETVVATKDKLTSFYDRFRNKKDDADEDKASSLWIRKLKTIFDPVKNAWKKMGGGASKMRNMLSMIGKPLLLALMNPQLIKSITSAVGEYLSFDNISKFISNMWDDTKQFASDTFDAAMEKVKSFFGVKTDKKNKPQVVPKPAPSAAISATTTPQQAQSMLTGLSTQISAAKQRVDQAQKAYDSSPTDANKKALDAAKAQLQVLNVQFTQYSYKAKTAALSPASVDPAAKAQASVTTAPAGGTDATPVSTTLTPADPSAVLSRSSAAPQTEIIDGMPVYRSGRPFDAPGKKKEEPKQVEKRDAALAQIGLGSFGFDSSDPSLNILNLGMIS